MKNQVDQPKHVMFLMLDMYAAGIQKAFLRLATALNEQGIKVTVALCWDYGPLATSFPPEIPIHLLANDKAARKSTWKLAQLIRKVKPDAIIAGDDPTNVCAILAKKLALSQTRVVIEMQSSIKMKFENDPSPSAARKGQLLKYLYPMADRIIAVSKGALKDMSEFTGIPESRGVVLYNPTIGPELDEKGSEPWADRPFPGSTDPIILAVGRMQAQKDFVTLLKAFRLLLDKRPAKLLILGDGEDREMLEELAAELQITDHLAMPGVSKNPYPAMRDADVFVLSSRWEGCPLVLGEALYFGMNIVSTDCTWGPSEILEEGKWGRLVPVQDPAALAQGLFDALAEGKKEMPEEAWRPHTVAGLLEGYKKVLIG